MRHSRPFGRADGRIFPKCQAVGSSSLSWASSHQRKRSAHVPAWKRCGWKAILSDPAVTAFVPIDRKAGRSRRRLLRCHRYRRCFVVTCHAAKT